MEKVEQLRIEIREEEVPYFTEQELDYYLSKNGGCVNNAAYECLIIKSENTGLRVSGLNTQDSSRYFLRLAQKFRPTNSGILGGG